MLDGSFITVSINSESDVIACALNHLNLEKFRPYFALYIMSLVGEKWTIFRKLYKFESAYVSVKRLLGVDAKLRLTLVRDYWNPKIDEILLKNDSGLNLLFAECYSCFTQEWLIAKDAHSEGQMAKLLECHLANRDFDSKREFVNICRGQKYFSCLQFGPMFW